MGVPSLDGLGPIGGNDHAPGEYLEVALDRAPDGARRGAAPRDRARPGRPRLAGRRPEWPERRRISSGGPWEARSATRGRSSDGDSCWVVGHDRRRARTAPRRTPATPPPRRGPRGRSSSGPSARPGSRWPTSSGPARTWSRLDDARGGRRGPRRAVRRHPARRDARPGRGADRPVVARRGRGGGAPPLADRPRPSSRPAARPTIAIATAAASPMNRFLRHATSSRQTPTDSHGSPIVKHGLAVRRRRPSRRRRPAPSARPARRAGGSRATGAGSRSIAGAEQPDRPRRVGEREHDQRERDELGAHRLVSSAGRRRALDDGVGHAVSVGRRLACRAAPSRGRPRFGTSSPTAGPMTPPAMIPTVGDTASDTPTPTTAPTIAATSSRRPLISPTASPIIAAGKITSMPSRSGSTIARAERRPGERREEPRDERRRRSRRTSSRSASNRPSRRKWAIESANASSVRRCAATARCREGPCRGTTARAPPSTGRGGR